MLIATIPSVLWIDRVGRKPVLTIGAIGMGTCHIIIAVIVAKNMDQWASQAAAGWAAVCMVWLFVIHFGYSWGPCAWIIVAEIWPLSTRPYGVALGASSNWMNNFIVGQVTPDMLAAMPYGTYILFGGLTYIGAAFIWFLVPETKRLTLEEMVGLCPFHHYHSKLTYMHRTSSLAPRAQPRPTSSAWRRSTLRLASPSSSAGRALSLPLGLTLRSPRLARRLIVSKQRRGYPGWFGWIWKALLLGDGSLLFDNLNNIERTNTLFSFWMYPFPPRAYANALQIMKRRSANGRFLK
jgi:MFS family permease